MKFILVFFYKYLFSSQSYSLIRTISIISICSLMVSVTSLLVVISIMQGFGSSIRKRLLSKEPHLIIQPNSQTQSHQKILNNLNQTFENSHLRSGVQQMRIFETQDFVIKNNKGHLDGLMGRGYLKKDVNQLIQSQENEYFSQMNSYLPTLSEGKSQYPKNVLPLVHLGSDSAQRLKVFTGDIVTLMSVDSLISSPFEIPLLEDVKVANVLYTEDSSIFANNLIYEIQSLPSFSNTSSLNYGVEIFLKNPQESLLYLNFLRPSGFKIQSWKDRHSSLFFALKIEKWLMFLFLALATLIASFSISSAISLLITQKKKDLGILMAMGWSIGKIKRLFCILTLMISGIGILGGTLLGYIICVLIQSNPIPILPAIYYDRALPVQIDIELFILVPLLALLLAFVSGIIPLRLFTSFAPVQLLKKSHSV